MLSEAEMVSRFLLVWRGEAKGFVNTCSTYILIWILHSGNLSLLQFLSLISLNGSDFGSAMELGHYYKIHFQQGGKLFALSKMTDWTINIALSRVQIDYYNLLHPAIYKEMPPQYSL